MPLLILVLAFSCARNSNKNLFPDDRLTLTSVSNVDELMRKMKNLPKGKNKFALTKNALIISTSGKKRPHHSELASGEQALSGGYISFIIADDRITNIMINNRSGRLCPTYKSLLRVSNFLARYGLKKSKITLLNKPNVKKCSR